MPTSQAASFTQSPVQPWTAHLSQAAALNLPTARQPAHRRVMFLSMFPLSGRINAHGSGSRPRPTVSYRCLAANRDQQAYWIWMAISLRQSASSCAADKQLRPPLTLSGWQEIDVRVQATAGIKTHAKIVPFRAEASPIVTQTGMDFLCTVRTSALDRNRCASDLLLPKIRMRRGALAQWPDTSGSEAALLVEKPGVYPYATLVVSRKCFGSYHFAHVLLFSKPQKSSSSQRSSRADRSATNRAVLMSRALSPRSGMLLLWPTPDRQLSAHYWQRPFPDRTV